MTSELEKQFFDTFGIEPKTNREYGYTMAIYNEAGTEEVKFYPQITDRILLELIRLGLNYDFVIHSKSVEELKEKLLVLLMYNEAEFKQQVQELFKEVDYAIKG